MKFGMKMNLTKPLQDLIQLFHPSGLQPLHLGNENYGKTCQEVNI